MRVDNVRLNSHQKIALAIVASSATSKVAAEDLAANSNLNQAAILLTKLGVLNYSASDASFTESGLQVAKEENIVDDAGQLTVNGKVYLKMNSINNAPDAIEQSPVGESLLYQLLTITTT